MKRLLFLCVFLTFVHTANALSVSDVAGNYNIIVADENSFVQLDAALDSNGVYTVYEKRIVGGKTLEYPLLFGIFYVNTTGKVSLQIGEKVLLLSYVGGNLVGFIDGVSVSFLKYSFINTVCEYTIEKLFDNIFLIATNKENCYSSPVVENADIVSIQYLQTGDAILTISLENSDQSLPVEVKTGTTVYTFSGN